MIKTLTAYIFEMDEVEDAVAQALEQLDLEHNLMKNSVGIITCYPGFIDTGVVSALCGSLPFAVVGCTTLGDAAAKGLGQLMLALSVLTSDEIHFSAAITGSLSADQTKPIVDAYLGAAEALPEPSPSLVFAFAPMIRHVGGEILLDKLDEVSGQAPIFGTVACDHVNYERSCTIYNGEAYREAMTMILVSGPIEPTFFTVSIPENKIQKQRAIITGSHGNLLQEVNNMPLLQYLKTLGLAEDDGVEGSNAIPFVVDYNDGTQPVARAIYLITEDGSAVCGGDMPVNATLAVGSMDYDDVLLTNRKLLKAALSTGKNSGVLVFSCLSRNLILGVDTLKEMQQTREILADVVPYQFAYAGGEICPLPDETGRLVNRFHNYSLIGCIF